MPKNVYKKQAKAQTKLGMTLDDIRHEGAMSKLDLADNEGQLKTIEGLTEGIAQVTNIIKGQRRIDEQDEKASKEAEKLGWEKTVVKKGSWLGEQGFIDEIGYKDPETGDIFTPEYLTEKAEQDKVFREQGVDFDKYDKMLAEAKGDTAEIMNQFKSFQKVQSQVGKDYGALIDVVNTFGNQYRLAGENGEYDMLDFESISENLDFLSSRMESRDSVTPDMDVPNLQGRDEGTFDADEMGILKQAIEDWPDIQRYTSGYQKAFGLGGWMNPKQYSANPKK